MKRKAYPSDVCDDEWAFVAPYLTLMTEDAPQRVHPLREVFNGLRYIVRAEAPWRMMPNDLPPWQAVYQQTRRWLAAGVFKAMVHDLRALLRVARGRNPEPSAAIFDSRTLRSTPESGARAGYDGAKRKRGSKVHMAVDTVGYLLTLFITAANEQDRTRLEKWWPYVLRIHATAQAMLARDAGDFDRAVAVVTECRRKIAQLPVVDAEEFQIELERSGEILGALEAELRADRPLNQEEQLERDLAAAVEGDDFERAAMLRDRLKEVRAARKSAGD